MNFIRSRNLSAVKKKWQAGSDRTAFQRKCRMIQLALCLYRAAFPFFIEEAKLRVRTANRIKSLQYKRKLNYDSHGEPRQKLTV